jgi:hypothetical protein
MTHQGPVLVPSIARFDEGGSGFCSAFIDQDDPETIYLYYTGGSNTKLDHTAIGVATSKDGKQFRKLDALNPIIEGERDQFNSRQSLTPAVVRVSNHYYMFFAGTRDSFLYARKSRIGVACADDPQGPWKILGPIAEPELDWEGWSIDIGPNVVDLGEGKLLLYYSNVFNGLPAPFWLPILPRFLRRRLGILNIEIKSPSSITTGKYKGNPLKHLNGPRGSPSESLFCPGYLCIEGQHILFPGMSTYSVGFPFQQYVGMVSDVNPFFSGSNAVQVLIDGTDESEQILRGSGQIALDTPSPVWKEGKLHLYYSVMGRKDGVWKTALSIIDYRKLEQLTMIWNSRDRVRMSGI